MDVPHPRLPETFTFADLVAPAARETFLADILGKKPLHVPGTPAKFAFAMSWELLNGILDQSAIWTPQTLQLAINGNTVPPAQYVRQGLMRDGAPGALIDFDKVRALVRQGASIVLNGIETLTPGIKQIADALACETNGKVQANLYCSWKRQQAFDVHFDTHDVFAMQIAGDKVWRIYQRHFKDPVNHPAFKKLDTSFHHQHKGAPLMEFTMRPGDLVYIPRGFYHDALAESEASVHVSFSVIHAIGIDVVTVLYELAIMDEVFRQALPSPELRGGAALDEHLMRLVGRMREMLRDPKARARVEQLIRDFRSPVERLKLPDDAGEH
jgi:hypothetical protein